MWAPARAPGRQAASASGAPWQQTSAGPASRRRGACAPSASTTDNSPCIPAACPSSGRSNRATPRGGAADANPAPPQHLLPHPASRAREPPAPAATHGEPFSVQQQAACHSRGSGPLQRPGSLHMAAATTPPPPAPPAARQSEYEAVAEPGPRSARPQPPPGSNHTCLRPTQVQIHLDWQRQNLAQQQQQQQQQPHLSPPTTTAATPRRDPRGNDTCASKRTVHIAPQAQPLAATPTTPTTSTTLTGISAPPPHRRCSAQRPPPRPLAAALLPALLVLLALGGGGGWPAPRLVYGSVYTGTAFPFENCVEEQRHSRFYATLYSYRENRPMNTSTICLQIQVLDNCTPGRYRCCRTSINKLKVFPALNCRGSVASALVNGNTIMSYYWEEHQGFDILKVTPLAQWLSSPVAAEGAIVCLNLQPPCWTASTFSYSPQLLEYALYDKKVNGYECCPTGTVLFTPSEPGFPSRPPPSRMPPFPPDVPQLPPSPRPPPRKKLPPPASPRPPSQPPPQSPPPRPFPPPPPKGKKSPPPRPSTPNTPPPGLPPPNPPPRSLPPPPSPPPPRSPTPRKRPPPPNSLPPAGCNVVVALRRSAAANQGFTDAFCDLFGALVMLPLTESTASPPDASYKCAISDPTNMVLTVTLPTAGDARRLLTLYGDAVQQERGAALLQLSDCGSDYATLSSGCVEDVAPVTISCAVSPPLPPPPKKRPPPPNTSRSPPPPPPPPVRSPPPPPLSPSPPPPLTVARVASPSPPPPRAPAPRILLSGNSAYLLYSTPATFNASEATCVGLGGHLAAIGSEEEFLFLSDGILSGLAASGGAGVNTWFGLTIRTDAGAAIPGYNTDGSRLSYMPEDFQYDRTRSVVRYYMLACSLAAGACAYRYSPGGSADMQPAFVCEFAS